MALPQNIANSSIPGEVTSLGTLTAELKTTELKLKISAKPPAALEASGQFTIVVGQEIMLVTAGQTTLEWTVTRKSEVPSAEANHPIGTEVFHFLTAGALESFVIKNQTTEQASANFNVGGAAVIKETLKVAGATTLTGTLTVTSTDNPSEAVIINPTTSTAVASSCALFVNPTFTGTASNVVALRMECLLKPSASIAIGYSSVNIAKGEPPVGVTITTVVGAYYRADTGSTEGAVTETHTLQVASPVMGSIKPTTIIGVDVLNHGATGITTSVGIDVLTQTLSTTAIGVRIAKASTYTLQLTDEGGTTAGGITFGTDTAIFRSAAKILKITTILDAETGFRIAGAAAAGKYLRGDGTNFVSSALKGGDLETRSVTAASLTILWKDNAHYGTTETLAGEPEVIGATLLSKKEEKLKVDGLEPTVAKRVLVKNQAATKDNGIYEVVKEGKAGEKWELKRTTDANTRLELDGATVLVRLGTVNAGSFWLQSADVITVGTTAQVWEPLAGTESIRTAAVTEEKLAKAVQEKITPPAWEKLTLGAKVEAGGGLEPAARTEDGATMVRLRGRPKIKAVEELKIGETLATVPAGLRPLKTMQFPALSGPAVALLTIAETTGIITLGVAVTAGQTVALDGITFSLT